MSTCVHMRDIESAVGNESIKCPDADPCAALRADLERRQLAAGDEAAERRIADAQSLRGFADSQCKVGVHCVEIRRHLWTWQDIFLRSIRSSPHLTNVPKCP